VVRRKGENSKGNDRPKWPYQVALPADGCTGAIGSLECRHRTILFIKLRAIR